MNKPIDRLTFKSTCPHDCPSTCGLSVELDAAGKISKVRGDEGNSYTAGVICAKVARYAERVHHPDRLTKSYRRVGERGGGGFQEIDFEDALDEVAEKFTQLEAKHGSETIWPYYFAGTMGLVQRDCINGLRNLKKYSGQHSTICTTPAWGGYIAGTGKLGGVDPREMAKSDCVVIWGTNPVATQVNVMTHAIRARKDRGAKIAVVDIYDTGTMKQADLKLILKPGTDGALAAAVMHILFRDGYADWDYLEKYSDDPKGLEHSLIEKSPRWASEITGLSVEQIEEFAKLIGQTKRTYIRLGYGMTRQQNGAVVMHAITSIAAVTGSWLQEGGGAFHSNSGSYPINNMDIQGVSHIDANIRTLDQSRIGAVLCGEEADLYGGPPVNGLFIQNTNPMVVAPDLVKVRQGFAREDLFTCVHEQFMTETAAMADIVLPATMFLEHDDIYRGGGHTHFGVGPKIMDPPEGCFSNYEVVCGLAQRLGLDDPMFELTAREHVDGIAKTAGSSWESLDSEPWQDIGISFEDAHFINGFNWPDGKYRFQPNWDGVASPSRPPKSMGLLGDYASLPEFPDHWVVNEDVDDNHPYKLATSPARQFLNSSFTETPTGQKREGRPSLLVHADDLIELDLHDEDLVEVGNDLGSVFLHVKAFSGLQPKTVIAEGIWPNKAHVGGQGINTLITAKPIAPFGGASFHDCRVWIKKA